MGLFSDLFFQEGQNIHGLFIEGARWNRLDGRLEESEAKKLQRLGFYGDRSVGEEVAGL